jgi:hypothetical protein
MVDATLTVDVATETGVSVGSGVTVIVEIGTRVDAGVAGSQEDSKSAEHISKAKSVR